MSLKLAKEEAIIDEDEIDKELEEEVLLRTGDLI